MDAISCCCNVAGGDTFAHYQHIIDLLGNHRSEWNLAEDAKLTEGLSYMASLNPREPAVFAMLGVLSWRNHDLNLAAAFCDRLYVINHGRIVASGTPHHVLTAELLRDARHPCIFAGWGTRDATEERAIADKVVTYDFARLMSGATQVSCSGFGKAMIDRM